MDIENDGVKYEQHSWQAFIYLDGLHQLLTNLIKQSVYECLVLHITALLKSLRTDIAVINLQTSQANIESPFDL